MAVATLNRIVVIGTGDHGRVLLELFRAKGAEVLGMVEPGPEIRSAEVDGCRVLGTLEQLDPDEVRDAGFVVALGNNRQRASVFERLLAEGLPPVAAIHPAAILLGGALAEPGAQVCAGAIIGVGATIGANAIVNTGAIVDHDVVVGRHAFVAPGARLAGRVIVEEGGFVGIGAVARQGVRIGHWATVGAGAAVVDDVSPGATVVGVPARPITARAEQEELA